MICEIEQLGKTRRLKQLAPRGLLLAVALGLWHNAEGAQVILESSRSPNGKYAIVSNEVEGGFRYDIVDVDSHKSVLVISPKLAQDDPIKIHFAVCWSPKSDNIAMLTSYGVRLSDVEIFSKGQDGAFHAVAFNFPSVKKLCNLNTSKDKDAPETPEYALGGWINNENIRVAFGFTQGLDESEKHYLAVGNIQVEGRAAKVANAKCKGILSNEAARKFFATFSK